MRRSCRDARRARGAALRVTSSGTAATARRSARHGLRRRVDGARRARGTDEAVDGAAARRCTRASGGRRAARRRCRRAVAAALRRDRRRPGGLDVLQQAADVRAARAPRSARARADRARAEPGRGRHDRPQPPRPARRRAPAALRRGRARRAALRAEPPARRAERRGVRRGPRRCIVGSSGPSPSAWSAASSSSATCRCRRPSALMGDLLAPAAARRRRAHRVRARRHGRGRARRAGRTPWRRSSRRSATSRAIPALPHIRVGRIQVESGSRRRSPTWRPSSALRRRGDGRRAALGERAGRRPARPRRGAPRMVDGAGAGGRAEPHGAPRADRAQELRQLHVHAHGERVDPDDGRRRAALGIDGALLREFGLAGADARHRQGADAARDPEQAGQADRRGVRRS